MRINRNGKCRAGVIGFTLAELLMVMVGIAIVAGLAIGSISGSHRDVEHVKLRSDVENLNSAVDVYLANGGSMDGVGTIEAALSKLMTEADQASAPGLVGLKGGMLDPRLRAEMMDPSDLALGAPRVLWKTAAQRFVLANSGQGGAKRFYIEAGEGPEDALVEARETALEYGEQTGWVWDYVDAEPASGSGVEEVDSSSPVIGGYNAPRVDPSLTRLAPPTFSLDAGLYSYFDFDLVVELTNPNPEGVSEIYYTLDNTRWQVYEGGGVSVAANQVLTAYAVSSDAARYADSDFNQAQYGSTFVISGGAGGDFFNPEGPDGMVTNLLDGERSTYFTFGTATGTPDPSWLLFNGASFADIGENVSFLLGTLDYYNGTIRTGTEAIEIDLAIDLSFDGGTQNLAFNYGLELISTQNLEGNTAEESADYVRLGSVYSDVPVELGGVAYNLILEFGKTTESGFSSIDQFHVIEGESASGDLYGRLIRATGGGEG